MIVYLSTPPGSHAQCSEFIASGRSCGLLSETSVADRGSRSLDAADQLDLRCSQPAKFLSFECQPVVGWNVV